MGMIGKVVGLVTLFGFAAIQGCANPDDGASDDSEPLGITTAPLVKVNGWQVNANLPLNGGNGEIKSRAVFKSNLTSTTQTRKGGTVLVKLKPTPVTCQSDADCDPNYQSFCLTQDGSSVQKGCFTPLAATAGVDITLAPGASTSVSAPWYPATSGYYYTVAVLSKDNGPSCAFPSLRENPANCARSLSDPVYYQHGPND